MAALDMLTTNLGGQEFESLRARHFPIRGRLLQSPFILCRCKKPLSPSGFFDC
jgi:hypothetical protein